MKIGFYRGATGIEAGGVAPYATRLWNAISAHTFPENIELELIADPSNARRLVHLGLVGKIASRIHDGFSVAVRRGALADRIDNAENRRSPAYSCDLLHVPYQTPPTYRHPFICTMHDVQECHFPENFSASQREWRAINHRKSIENATRIVVSFQHVKDDLIKYFGCPPDKVVVIPLPVAECVFPPLGDNQQRSARKKFDFLGRYFLYPAQTWPHKNHLRLIEAFERLRADDNNDYTLVCTGIRNSYFEETLASRVSASPHRAKIHFLGAVKEFELQWLYENSAGVVIPTLYEAGSFPLLEAMSLELPVVCAKTTSLPDTLGNNEFLFDPYSVASIYEAMSKLANDSEFRRRSQENSGQRIRELRATPVAKHYEALWCEVAAQIGSVG